MFIFNQKTKPPPRIAGRGFWVARLRARHARCVRAFFAVTDFKGDCIANVQLVEFNTFQFVGMEEKVFYLTLAGDKTEPFLLYERFDCSVHRMIDLLNNVRTKRSSTRNLITC